jgi:hypothetical protein
MNKYVLALTAALSLVPAMVLAGEPNPPAAPPAPPTAAQRQALMQTFETFHKQMEQLYQQMRAQMLSSLTPAHRQAVGNLIGAMATSANPDPAATAKQVDAILSQSEQQRIVATAASFGNQFKTLHEQMRAQLQKEFPNGGPPMMGDHPPMMGGHEGAMHAMPTDAGGILLMALNPDPPMMMHHMPMRR